MGVEVGDNLLVTFQGALHGQRIMSTFGFVCIEAGGDQDRNGIIDQFHNEITDADKLLRCYEACCPHDYVGLDVWYQFIRPTRFAKRTKAWPAFPSNWAVDANAPNIAAVVERRGALGRRDNVSTLHVPCSGDSTAVVNGYLTPAYLAKLQDLADQARSAVNVGSPTVVFQPSILNGPLYSNVTPLTAAFPQVTSRVMRRRTVGLGI